MAKATTSSFVTQIPLKTSSKEQVNLKKIFWSAKQQYNALLGECLKRLNAMRADKRFKEAIAHYKKKGRKGAAKSLFKQLAKDYAYSEYDLHGYTKQFNTKGNPLSIGSTISQKLATRAFNAVKEYELKKRGKPRFKGFRGINSIEDKRINANLRLKNNILHYKKLQFPLLYDPKDPIHYHGLSSKIKYARIVKRSFNGRVRYFTQLICEGMPWIKSKNKAGKATIGLDIGPQTIAIVSEEQKHASLHVFANELKQKRKTRKKLQQKIARQIRAANPTCYEPDVWAKKDKQWKKKQGKCIRRKRPVNRTKAFKKTASKLADMARRQAAHRKIQHGKLTNEVLRIGNHIKTEDLSYKAFQRLFGRSVGLRAPGMFVTLLKRKAENADGRVEEISTYKTKLSQSCHCGEQKKKPLRQRWHTCSCGVNVLGKNVQRDLYSAYLACFVENNTLIVDRAQKAWSGMEIALHTAMSKMKHSTSRSSRPASLGF